jgi:transglutaminase-like putative cysteine protease
MLEILDARQYILDSPMITISPELADYAQSSFLPNRTLVDVVHDLMGRIYKDFTYDPTFTTIATPLSDVLSFRRGVCQDFAHLAIGCLRAYGMAARYISGYVETLPEPGKPRLVGADASHAWFSVYIPGTGWLDFDPTNNTVPLDQHITLAWGRDYADVTPLKGIAFGGGQHTLSVSVDVLRLE